MCDCPNNQHRGWLGWPTEPTPQALRATGPWHDLSHLLNNDIPVPKIFPKPSFERVLNLGPDILNVTRIDMVCHLGTHIDAPAHVLSDGPTMQDVPPHYFHGSGVVWPISVSPRAAITADDLQSARPTIEPGEILLLSTGWAKKFGQASYFDNPYLDDDAVDWILEHQVKWVGIDFVSPELPFALRPEGFNYPVHRALMSNGVLIVENLADCSALAKQRVEVVCGALNIEQADGAPARIFARSAELSD